MYYVLPLSCTIAVMRSVSEVDNQTRLAYRSYTSSFRVFFVFL